MNATHNHTMGSTLAAAEGTPIQATPRARLLATSPNGTPPGTRGLDVSGWQVFNASNWAAIAADGARFAYIKATENTDYVSSQFNEQYTDSYAAGLIRGAYHFAIPSASSGAAQANWFVDHGGTWSSDGRTLPPLLDIEYNYDSAYGNTCYNQSQAGMVAWISDFSQTVQARTGRLPAIYSTTDWWRQCTGNTSAFSANPLFIASWPSNVSSGPGTLPASWSRYAFWQYTSKGTIPGWNALVDLDVFNGSTDDLSAFAFTARPAGSLVQAQGDGAVYLISGGLKHHIPSYNDYAIFASRLGAVTTVSPAYVANFPTGLPATRYVHDPRVGILYLLQSDGSKHPFPTMQSITNLGFNFGSYVNLDGTQADAFSTGTQVTSLFQPDGGGPVYFAENNQKRYVPTLRTILTTLGTSPWFVPSIDAAVTDSMPNGPLYLAPNSLVKEQHGSMVFMAIGDHSLIYLPSFNIAAEFGQSGWDAVGDGALGSLSTVAGSLSPFVACAGKNFVASQGSLLPVSGTDLGGMAVSTLSDDACGYFPQSPSSVASPLFFRAANGTEVYVATGGVFRHVRDYSTLMSLNGSRPLTIITWNPGLVGDTPKGGPLFADGAFVQFNGEGEVYYVSSGSLRHVQSFDTLLRLGGGRMPAIVTVSAAFKPEYTFGAPITS